MVIFLFNTMVISHFSECNKNDIVQWQMWYLLYYIPLVLYLTLLVKTDIYNIRFRQFRKILKFWRFLKNYKKFHMFKKHLKNKKNSEYFQNILEKTWVHIYFPPPAFLQVLSHTSHWGSNQRYDPEVASQLLPVTSLLITKLPRSSQVQ